jgi:hypothetical protein
VHSLFSLLLHLPFLLQGNPHHIGLSLALSARQADMTGTPFKQERQIKVARINNSLARQFFGVLLVHLFNQEKHNPEEDL